MATPAEEPRRATYEDLLAVPDHLVAEIVDGVLYASPRPAPPHALAASGLGYALMGPYHYGRGGGGGGPGGGGWWILHEPELHFTPPCRRSEGGAIEALVPDLAGWRRERMPRLPDTAAFPLAPDWICEVVSPSTAALDRVRKMAVYAREGVRHAWIVDPRARSLEVFRLEDERWLLAAAFEGARTVHAEPFDAEPLDLTLLWLPEEPGSREG